MLNLNLNIPTDRVPHFLFIGAHCDDIEIGCGGAVLELAQRYPEAVVYWVVLSGNSVRRKEAVRAAKAFARNWSSVEILIKDFRESYFPSQFDLIKDFFEDLKVRTRPDMIFTHFREDLHQDHRVVSEMTWNSFRDHMILEYEIPKYDGGLGSPSFFIPISSKARRRKVDILMRIFQSQKYKHWFTSETFGALMRLRGLECNSTSGYAEAFYSRKLVF